MFFLTTNICSLSHRRLPNSQFCKLKTLFFFFFLLHTLKLFQPQWTYCEVIASSSTDNLLNRLSTSDPSISFNPRLPETDEEEEEARTFTSSDTSETNTGVLKELNRHAELVQPFKDQINEDAFLNKHQAKKKKNNLSKKETQPTLITPLPTTQEKTKDDLSKKKEPITLITPLSINQEKKQNDPSKNGEQPILITPLPVHEEKINLSLPLFTAKKTLKEYLYTNIFSTFILLTWITFIYLLQLYIDRNFHLSFYRSNHACSCLLTGGNLRGLGETSLVTFSRMVACCFIHISFCHYLTTLVTLMGCSCFAFTLFPIYNWIPYWIVPLYFVCGLAKSIMIWKKKLYSVGTSSSASGSSFGIAAFLWVLHSLTDSSKSFNLYNFIFWGCILFSGFLYLQDDVDIKSLFVSIVLGGLSSFLFSAFSKPKNVFLFIGTGKWITYFCYVLCFLVYCEIFREALLDKRELLIRSYVKAYVLQETSEEKRLIPNRGQELTQKLVNILHQENVPQTSEAILHRLLKYSEPSTTFLTNLGGQVA